MKIQEILQKNTSEALAELSGAELPSTEIQVQETRKEFEGDYTINVFPLIKLAKKNPQETAEFIGNYLLDKVAEVEKFNIIKGFLNISLRDGFWVKELTKHSHVWEKAHKPKKIMVEYSSPNTNKPLHLGHIRNNLLGYSCAEILKARGHKVTKANIINDRGIHICKSMLAWMRYGHGETPESTGIKGDHLVGKYYVEFNNIYEAEIAVLERDGLEKEQAKKEAPIIKEAQALLLKWEEGDEETLEIWNLMNGWVYAGFDETYKALGVDFDLKQYESQTYILGKKIVNEGLEKGVFFKKEDGSVWIDLTDEGLDEKLLLRADGTSVYMTQDLGTALERFNDFHLDSLVYVVGNEQEYHFKVLSLVLKKLGYSWWGALFHLSYGMVDLPHGKMKSREGTVVDADDLIAEMLETAKQKTIELGKIEGMPAEEQTELFRKIGMAALKFYILRTDPKKRMVFNPEESIDFHGFTGPFVQYSFTRIKSILRKRDEGLVGDNTNKGIEGITPEEAKRVAKALEQGLNTPLSLEERELIKTLYKRNEKLEEAEREYSPAVLANYVYELAKLFNKFYHERQVLNEPDAELRQFRLVLVERTADVMEATLKLLGIEVPERM